MYVYKTVKMSISDVLELGLYQHGISLQTEKLHWQWSDYKITKLLMDKEEKPGAYHHLRYVLL